LQQKEKQTSGTGKPVQKFRIRFVATEKFLFPCNIGAALFLQAKEFGLFY
jgi:hypothetical protein